MTKIFGIDASSFQGNVDWAAVDGICDFGAEKVTEGTSYTNPYWPVARQAMAARAKATGFVPLAYLFLDRTETGAAQAEYFASKSGLLTGFGIAVDLERAPDGSPSIQQARGAVARLRELFPHHPIGGYAPHWYTGSSELTFFDWLWASSYVGGSGRPEPLYFSVPEAWWGSYGGMTPSLLQFTDKAQVPGVSGTVDCSAFRGTAEQLRALVLPKTILVPPPPPVPVPVPVPVTAPPQIPSEPLGDNLLFVVPGAPALSYPTLSEEVLLYLTGESGAVVQAVLHHTDGTQGIHTVPLETGKAVKVNAAVGWPKVEVVTLRRLDSKAQLGATARFIS